MICCKLYLDDIGAPQLLALRLTSFSYYHVYHIGSCKLHLSMGACFFVVSFLLVVSLWLILNSY